MFLKSPKNCFSILIKFPQFKDIYIKKTKMWILISKIASKDCRKMLFSNLYLQTDHIILVFIFLYFIFFFLCVFILKSVQKQNYSLYR
eukprot:UN21663